MSDTPQPDGETGTAERVRIERWFLRRGLPQFIADYNARDDVLTRMVPFMLLLVALQVFGAMDVGWRWWENLLSLLGAGVMVAAGWVGANRLRGRPDWARPDRVGVFEVIGLLVVVPFVAVLVATGFDASQAATLVAVNLLVFGIGYAATSFGLLSMLRWAFIEMFRHVGSVLTLMARSLPLTLVFATFLFLNAELWQVASDFTPVLFGLAVGLLVLVGALFVLLRLPAEVDDLRTFSSWDDVLAVAANAPLGEVARNVKGTPSVVPLSRRHWLNVSLVWLFVQSVQILLVSVLIAGFYGVFGLFTVRESTIRQWTTLGEGDALDPLWRLSLGGGEMVVTWELVQVAVFLGAFSGLQFAVQTLIDDHHRKEFLAPVIEDVREALAVREVYLATISSDR
jgi:hypothetical protein